jgi:hypothetical protein
MHPRRTHSVVENVGFTFTPRSVGDDRWQEELSSLVRTFFASLRGFFFWKERTQIQNLESKIQYENPDRTDSNASNSKNTRAC